MIIYCYTLKKKIAGIEISFLEQRSRPKGIAIPIMTHEEDGFRETMAPLRVDQTTLDFP